MTENRKSWFWIFSTFLLLIAVILLSITIGVVGLDRGDDDIDPYPIGPGTEIRTGKYQYITYIDEGKIDDGVRTKSLINTIEYIAFDAEGNLAEQGIQIIDDDLEELLIDNGANYGLNIFDVFYSTEGSIEDIQDSTPSIDDFVKAIVLSFDTKGYLYLDDYKYNTYYEGGKLSTTDDGYLAFFIDVVGEGYVANTGVHDFGILFNWSWGKKDYSNANFGATITASIFFGNLDNEWAQIKKHDGDLSFLNPLLYKEVLSFYLDSDGHVELYGNDDNILIKGDFDFILEDWSGVSGSIHIPVINIDIPSKISVYVGFKQDEENNAQEEWFNQDYVTKIDITPSAKIIGWDPGVVVDFAFDIQFLKIPHIFNHN